MTNAPYDYRDIIQNEHEPLVPAKRVLLYGKTAGGVYVPILVSSGGSVMSSYVPYTGATANVDLGSYTLTTTGTGTFGSATRKTILDDGVYAINATGIMTLNGSSNQTQINNSLVGPVFYYAYGYENLGIGRGASVSGQDATAVGGQGATAGTSAVAFGSYAYAGYEGGIAIGYGSYIGNPYGTAIGYSAKAYDNAVALGEYASAMGNSSIAIGQYSYASNSNEINFSNQDSTYGTVNAIDGYTQLDIYSGVADFQKNSITTARTITGRLTPPAGTATAGTAPLKFTSGPILTTPEAGTIEYLSAKFYIRGTEGLAFGAATEYINSANAGYLDYRTGTAHRFRINTNDTLDLISNKLSPTANNGVSLGDSTHTFNSIYGTSVFAKHWCADGTSAISDGTYKIFDGSYLGLIDGTITMKDGLITAYQTGGLPTP